MNRKTKWITLAGGLAVAAAILSLKLLALPAPRPSPSPATVQTSVSPGVVATFAPLLQTSPSTQPRITWSHPEISLETSVGRSFSTEVSFTSSTELREIRLEAVPGIARFLSLNPALVSSLPAGRKQRVAISVAIPTNTVPGTYEGTIHILSGQQTLPQTLKLSIVLQQSTLRASQIISDLRVIPNVTEVGQHPVIITAEVGNDATLLIDSIRLIQVDEAGQVLADLGQLHDDGSNGDSTAGDRRFTIRVTINASAPKTVFFKVSARYRDLANPLLSNPAALFIVQAGSPQEMFAQLANALEAGDVKAALKKFTATEANRIRLEQMTLESRKGFASGLRDAQFIAGDHLVRTYSLPLKQTNGDTFLITVTLIRTQIGEWIIRNW